MEQIEDEIILGQPRTDPAPPPFPQQLDDPQQLFDHMWNLSKDIVIMEIKKIDQSDDSIVTCTYRPLRESKELTDTYSPYLAAATVSIDFRVPADYPSSSPTVLATALGGHTELAQYFLGEARRIFDSQVMSISDPLRVGNLARAWRDSAREAYMEYSTKRLGADNFISQLETGSWEPVNQ